MSAKAEPPAHSFSAQQLPLSDAMKSGPDLSAAKMILRPFEPVAYVYSGLETFGEEQRETRWRALATQLAAQGASEKAISVLTSRASAAKEAPGTLALFAADDGSLLYECQLSTTSVPDHAGCSVPADVLPLLQWQQDRPPFVLVVADRAGAEVTASAGGGQDARTWQVTGPDDEIERNSPGGWSQPRYQRRAEDSWKHNAGRVAEAALAALADVRGQLLVLSGDVRAVQLLSEQLPESPGTLVCHITGSRSEDGSQSSRMSQVEHALAEAVTTQTQSLLGHLRERLGPGGAAVEGRSATIEALAAGRVAMLLVAAPRAESSPVWFGAEPTAIYADHEAALLADVAIRSGSMADVATRSALLSDARVRVIPMGIAGEPLDGIGAICRY